MTGAGDALVGAAVAQLVAHTQGSASREVRLVDWLVVVFRVVLVIFKMNICLVQLMLDAVRNGMRRAGQSKRLLLKLVVLCCLTWLLVLCAKHIEALLRGVDDDMPRASL